jgi:hypothetical protein
MLFIVIEVREHVFYCDGGKREKGLESTVLVYLISERAIGQTKI